MPNCIEPERCAEHRAACEKFHEERDRRHTGEIKALETVIKQSFSSLSDMIVTLQSDIPAPEEYKDIMKGFITLPAVITLVVFLCSMVGGVAYIRSEIMDCKNRIAHVEGKK